MRATAVVRGPVDFAGSRVVRDGDPAVVARLPLMLGADDEEVAMSPARQLAVVAVLGLALLLLASPIVMATWAALGGVISSTLAPAEHVSFLAALIAAGRIPLAFVQAIWLAATPAEQ